MEGGSRGQASKPGSGSPPNKGGGPGLSRPAVAFGGRSGGGKGSGGFCGGGGRASSALRRTCATPPSSVPVSSGGRGESPSSDCTTVDDGWKWGKMCRFLVGSARLLGIPRQWSGPRWRLWSMRGALRRTWRLVRPTSELQRASQPPLACPRRIPPRRRRTQQMLPSNSRSRRSVARRSPTLQCNT